MQKKIIALAIAAAFSAPAFADTSNVTLYGVADVSYDFISTGTTAAGAGGVTSNRVSSNTSRFGLKGSEDLGDGLSAIWQVESLVNVGNAQAAGTGIGGRNTFAGLSSSNWGTVLLGRHDTPYKISTRAFDQFADGIADNRSIMGGQSLATVNPAGVGSAGGVTITTNTSASAVASFDGRQDQVVAYISPQLGGMFTGAIGYVNLNPGLNLSAGNKSTAWSMAGMFNVTGGFYGSLAYEVHDLLSVGIAANTLYAGQPALIAGAKEKATKLGLGYTQDAFNVNFAYERTNDNITGANVFGHSDYYLSGKYMFGSDAVKAAYTHANNLANTTNTGANQFSLGYDHNMGKRTTLYALYTKISNNTGAGYSLSNNSSVGGSTTSAGLGASPSAVALGMKHTF